jgi:hypothetical protein
MNLIMRLIYSRIEDQIQERIWRKFIYIYISSVKWRKTFFVANDRSLVQNEIAKF